MRNLIYILLLISCSNTKEIEDFKILGKLINISDMWEVDDNSNVLCEIRDTPTSPFVYYINTGDCFVKTDYAQLENKTIIESTLSILIIEYREGIIRDVITITEKGSILTILSERYIDNILESSSESNWIPSNIIINNICLN